MTSPEPTPRPKRPSVLQSILMVMLAVLILLAVFFGGIAFGHWLGGSPTPPESRSSEPAG